MLDEGTRVRMLIPGEGDVDFTDEPDGEVEFREYPVGTICEIVHVDNFGPPQNVAYTILAPNGVVNVIDDTDKINGEYPWEVVSQ